MLFGIYFTITISGFHVQRTCQLTTTLPGAPQVHTQDELALRSGGEEVHAPLPTLSSEQVINSPRIWGSGQGASPRLTSTRVISLHGGHTLGPGCCPVPISQMRGLKPQEGG